MLFSMSSYAKVLFFLVDISVFGRKNPLVLILAANIGDNVYIGPNVCIVEDVIIGNNVTIGTGSVVTKSIPDNATVAGNYAKVLNYNNPGRFIKRKYEYCAESLNN